MPSSGHWSGIGHWWSYTLSYNITKMLVKPTYLESSISKATKEQHN